MQVDAGGVCLQLSSSPSFPSNAWIVRDVATVAVVAGRPALQDPDRRLALFNEVVSEVQLKLALQVGGWVGVPACVRACRRVRATGVLWRAAPLGSLQWAPRLASCADCYAGRDLEPHAPHPPTPLQAADRKAEEDFSVLLAGAWVCRWSWWSGARGRGAAPTQGRAHHPAACQPAPSASPFLVVPGLCGHQRAEEGRRAGCMPACWSSGLAQRSKCFACVRWGWPAWAAV